MGAMKLYILILTFIFLSCEKGQRIQLNEKQKVFAATGVRKARLYLAHGYGGDLTTFENEPFNSWRQQLQQQGIEVVTYNLPKQDAANFKSEKAGVYRAFYQSLLKRMTESIDAKYGKCAVNISGGVSFGGLHAMMNVALHPGYFQSWMAIKPVTDYTALTELKKTDSSKFSPFNETHALVKLPGFIVFGDNDERVNFRLTENLVEKIGNRGLTWVSMSGEDHATTQADLDNASQWIASQAP
jgi:hypothetical protein